MDDERPFDRRIETPDGAALRVHRDPVTGLTFLDLLDSTGELVDSRALDAGDLRHLAETLTTAVADAQERDVPVIVDVSAVLGRD